MKGKKYKKNMQILIGDHEEGIVVRKFKVILILEGLAVHFITEKHQAVCLPVMGAYVL